LAYVYRHIRLDKNEPFYIGVGEDNVRNTSKYDRAYDIYCRNKHWKDIYAKTSIEVEILVDDLPYEKAYEKEIEFIKLYGRTDLGTGILCNKTNGGPGVFKPVHSKKTLKKKRDNNKHRMIKVVQKDFDGNIINIWDCIADATKRMGGKSHANIINALNGNNLHAYNFKWEYFNQERQSLVVNSFNDRPRIVQMNLNGEVIKIWDWLEKLKKEGFNSSNISSCCKGKYAKSGGYKWEYFDKNKKYVFSEDKHWGKVPIKNKEVKEVKPKIENNHKIVQLSLTGEIIKIWENKDLDSFYRKNGIIACCRKVIKKSQGYIWKFEDESIPYIPIKRNIKKDRRFKMPNSKPVLRIDRATGELINEWAYQAEAARATGVNHKEISDYIFGKRKDKKYIWKYKI